MFIVFLFVVWKIIDIFISIILPHFIPFLGFFPYREMLVEYKLPVFLSSFANFDGVQYLTLVREGYNTYTQAYFPLYFLVVRVVSELFPMFNAARPHNDLVASLLVSNVCFLFGLFFFQKYLRLLFPKNKTIVLWTVLFLLFFPTSFFFGTVYTEGVFFFLFFGSLFFLQKKNYWIASMCAILASTTRLMGIFLIIPFLFHFVNGDVVKQLFFPKKFDKEKGLKNKGRSFRVSYLAILSPLLGLSGYMVYLWKTVGDPLFFFNAQPVFGANRSTHLIFLPQVYYRYFKILLTAQFNFQYFISLIEVLFFTFILALLCLDLYAIINKLRSDYKQQSTNQTTLLSLNFFSFANLLIPTLTGTFSSLPRYALFSISAFLYLGGIKNNGLKIALLGIFFIFHIVLLGFFIQGYFVG